MNLAEKLKKEFYGSDWMMYRSAHAICDAYTARDGSELYIFQDKSWLKFVEKNFDSSGDNFDNLFKPPFIDMVSFGTRVEHKVHGIGVVVDILRNGRMTDFPIWAYFRNMGLITFTADGKQFGGTSCTTLKIVE